MTVEITLALLKPDIAKYPRLVFHLQSKFQHLPLLSNNCLGSKVPVDSLYLLHRQQLQWTRHQAQEFYRQHEGKHFYNRLCTNMSSGEFEAWVLGGKDAISQWRKMLGPTRPPEARLKNPTSWRALYGQTDTRNAFHGSDSVQSARQEYSLVLGKHLGVTYDELLLKLESAVQ